MGIGAQAVGETAPGPAGGPVNILDILVIDGEPGESRRWADRLTAFGHRVAAADSRQAGLAQVARDAFDAVVLGADSPGLDGLSILRSLRDGGMAVPVLVVGKAARALDKAEWLDAGADDYMVAPVDPLELNARLKAFARARRLSRAATDTIRAGDIVVSPSRVRAWRGGQPLDLARTEFRLLAELVREAGAPVSRAALIERVWGADFVAATNIVEAHIRRLRIKLSQLGPDPIRTMRGVGYSIRD